MKLCSQKVLGPGNSIGWLASASDIYISGVVYISGFRMLFSAHAHGYNWDDLACRYFEDRACRGENTKFNQNYQGPNGRVGGVHFAQQYKIAFFFIV